MFDFIGFLRELFGGNGSNQEQPQEQPQEQTTNNVEQEDITSHSGDNVQFRDDTELSDNYANTLNDVVDFYKNEFNVSPHVSIQNSPEDLPEMALGATMIPADNAGQFHINLRHATAADEAEAEKDSKEGAADNFHPKNSTSIANTPVHEMGHAIYGMLFPEEEDSNIIQPSKQQTNYKNSWGLVDDALKDIGLVDKSNPEDEDNYDDEYFEEADKKISDISEYALNDPHETVAEALTDYYYNRDDSADLSKAIVNRLKSRGYMYGLEHSGGVGKTGSDNFIKNMRRYRVIQ